MYTSIIDCFQGFYHGPVVSKIWLCEKLEQVIDDVNFISPYVHILGCWQNVLAFIMQVRKPNFYTRIDGYDLDKLSIEASDRICNTWLIEKSLVQNHHVDFNTLNFGFEPNTIFINCSVDQFVGTTWFDKIPNGSLVAMQTTDITSELRPWQIEQTCKDLNEFDNKYKLSNVLFSGYKPIEYPNIKYNRLMIIGIK